MGIGGILAVDMAWLGGYDVELTSPLMMTRDRDNVAIRSQDSNRCAQRSKTRDTEEEERSNKQPEEGILFDDLLMPWHRHWRFVWVEVGPSHLERSLRSTSGQRASPVKEGQFRAGLDNGGAGRGYL
jgi:hypothetical protein